MADKPVRHQITRAVHASHDKHGRTVEITFDSDHGGVTLVTFPEALQALAAQMSELASLAMSVRSDRRGQARVEAMTVKTAEARAPISGHAVILSLRGSSGIVLHFALSHAQSAELRGEMERAEEQARTKRRIVLQ
jgi:hypothetical protein